MLDGKILFSLSIYFCTLQWVSKWKIKRDIMHGMCWSFKAGKLLIQVIEAVSAQMKTISLGNYPHIRTKREKDALVVLEI